MISSIVFKTATQLKTVYILTILLRFQVLSDNMALTVGEGVVISFNTKVVDTRNSGRDAPKADELSAFSSVSQQTTTAGPSCTSQGRSTYTFDVAICAVEVLGWNKLRDCNYLTITNKNIKNSNRESNKRVII